MKQASGLTVPITEATRLWGSVLGRNNETVVDWATLNPMVRVKPANVYRSILPDLRLTLIVTYSNCKYNCSNAKKIRRCLIVATEKCSFPRFRKEKLARQAPDTRSWWIPVSGVKLSRGSPLRSRNGHKHLTDDHCPGSKGKLREMTNSPTHARRRKQCVTSLAYLDLRGIVVIVII